MILDCWADGTAVLAADLIMARTSGREAAVAANLITDGVSLAADQQ